MNLYLLQQYQFIQSLYKNNTYLDVLMNIDDFFDILHVYAFPNWIDAQVVDVKFMKYFTNVILKADRNEKDKEKDKCPDPRAGVLLTKYDCKVEYIKTTEVLPVEVKSEKDVIFDKNTKKYRPKTQTNDVWIIDILIPNKHIINDKLFDLESIQAKIKSDDDESDSMESVVSNNDDLSMGSGTNTEGGM